MVFSQSRCLPPRTSSGKDHDRLAKWLSSFLLPHITSSWLPYTVLYHAVLLKLPIYPQLPCRLLCSRNSSRAAWTLSDQGTLPFCAPSHFHKKPQACCPFAFTVLLWPWTPPCQGSGVTTAELWSGGGCLAYVKSSYRRSSCLCCMMIATHSISAETATVIHQIIYHELYTTCQSKRSFNPNDDWATYYVTGKGTEMAPERTYQQYRRRKQSQ